MYPAQRIKELKDEGKLREAWQYGVSELENHPDDPFLKRSLFYLCFEEIKHIQETILERDNHAPNHTEQNKINGLLTSIVGLNMPIPSDEFRFLLWKFKANGEHYKGFVDLILLHGGNLFREEDFQPFKAEKGEAPSLLVRCARKVAAACLSHRSEWSIDVNAVLDFLQYATESASDTQLLWLKYDHAKCLLVAGRHEDARQLALQVLQTKPTESWAWGALGAAYQKDNHEAAISCFCKGISCAHEPQFSIPQRKGLVSLLIKKQNYEIASAQVKQLIDIYNSHGWRLKSDIEDYIASDWYDSSVDANASNDYIKQQASNASQYLVEGAKEHIGIVESHHKSGKGFNVYVSPDDTFPVRKALLESKHLPQLGQWLKLSISPEADEIIAVSSAEPGFNEHIDIQTGELRVNHKGFAFVSDTFIAPHLVDKSLDGQDVSVIRVWGFNQKKQEYTWRGIKVSPNQQ